MTHSGELLDATAPDDSVFADKGALDPLAEPDEVVARDAQEQQLARLLNGSHEERKVREDINRSLNLERRLREGDVQTRLRMDDPTVEEQSDDLL